MVVREGVPESSRCESTRRSCAAWSVAAACPAACSWCRGCHNAEDAAASAEATPPPPPPAAAAAPGAVAADDAGIDPEEAEMMALMGFGGFSSTQGKQVDDPNSNASAVHKKTTRRARQYMNRPGGFNRPLPDERTGVKSNKI